MILFNGWAPDEATFWQSWVKAGIVDEDRNFLPGYAGFVDVNSQSDQGWTPTKQIGTDQDGKPILEVVLGWHFNARVWGQLEAQMCHDLEQYNEDGTLKNVFERTYAALIFNLEPKEADEETGFPAGYRNEDGVTYADASAFSSPSNVWA